MSLLPSADLCYTRWGKLAGVSRPQTMTDFLMNTGLYGRKYLRHDTQEFLFFLWFFFGQLSCRYLGLVLLIARDDLTTEVQILGTQTIVGSCDVWDCMMDFRQASHLFHNLYIWGLWVIVQVCLCFRGCRGAVNTRSCVDRMCDLGSIRTGICSIGMKGPNHVIECRPLVLRGHDAFKGLHRLQDGFFRAWEWLFVFVSRYRRFLGGWVFGGRHGLKKNLNICSLGADQRCTMPIDADFAYVKALWCGQWMSLYWTCSVLRGRYQLDWGHAGWVARRFHPPPLARTMILP